MQGDRPQPVLLIAAFTKSGWRFRSSPSNRLGQDDATAIGLGFWSMGPMVFCPKGHVFESRMFRIENSTNITLVGNTEPCPVCGSTARVMDGTFDFVDGVVRVLSAPKITCDRLRALEQVLKDSTGQPREEVVQAIRKTDPKLGRALEKLHPERIRPSSGRGSALCWR